MILTILIFLLASIMPVQPREAYFNTSEGTVLTYERIETKTGKRWWSHTETVDSVIATPNGGAVVHMTVKMIPDKKKVPIKKPVSSSAVIRPDGTVEVNVAELAGEAANQKFSAFNFKTTGGVSLLSPRLKAGDSLDDIHSKVTWKAFSYSIDYIKRKVIRKERITVPAGTFDCIVLEEWKVEKGPLSNDTHRNLNWYALGYGLIRHDTFYSNGVQTTEWLVSVKR